MVVGFVQVLEEADQGMCVWEVETGDVRADESFPGAENPPDRHHHVG